MPTSTVRLVELLASVSGAADAADGFLPDHTLRATVLAAGLARATGADDDLVSDVMVGSLIRHLGCTGFAPEEAHRYGAGDDIALRHTMAAVDFAEPEDAVARISAGVAPDASPAERQRAIGALLGDGPTAEAAHHAAQCDAAESLAALLPVSAAARRVASDAFERWDGTGGPRGRAGDEISLVARIVEVAYVAELFRGRTGADGALAAVQRRAGRALDPAVAQVFAEVGPGLMGGLDDGERSTWDQLLAAEPTPSRTVRDGELDSVALAMARFGDLKSTWFTGHSEAVAALGEKLAVELGHDEQLRRTVRLAGLVHDIGRVAVPTGTWDVPRALGRSERARVEGHAAETARVLDVGGAFAAVGPVAAAAHERLDGSGYHRGCRGTELDHAARILAVADVAVALAEARPHRAALAAEAARTTLVRAAQDGALDPVVVEAALALGGGPVRLAPRWPAGLSDREVEVLRLVATGCTNKDIARHLGISAKTVAHHVGHVYDKTACRSRAGATLFALDAGLVGPGAHPSEAGPAAV